MSSQHWCSSIVLCVLLSCCLADISGAEPSGRTPKPFVRAEVTASTELMTPKTTLQTAKLSDSQRLMRDLFRTYRKELRPVQRDSSAVNVTMHLWFKQVLKVDEIDQILTIYCWLEEYWNDAYLQWDPAEYGGITVLHIPTDKLWRPDILVYNNADMNVLENELTTNAVLNFTGDIMCFRSIITKITCNLEMKYFPFDQQKCSMMFASWSYDGSKVSVFAKDSKRGNLEYYIENTEWKLLDFFYVKNVKYYDCCAEAYPDVTYWFVLERNPSYYILNLILPSVFITVVTMVGFFTPYSSTGENTEKVSLGVTALLSLAIILLMVADKMPATSKVIPLIGKYYIGLIWLIFAATIITTITLRLQSKGNAGYPVSENVKHIFFDWVSRFLLMTLDLPLHHPYHVAHDNKKKLNKKANDRCNGSVSATESTVLLLDTNGRLEHKRTSNQHYSNGMNGLCPAFGGANKVLQYPPIDTTDFLAPNVSPPPPINNWTEYNLGTESTTMSKEVIAVLTRTRETLRSIDGRMAAEERLVYIRKEWEQLARICERLLMLFFVFITVVFAFLMLYTHGEEKSM